MTQPILTISDMAVTFTSPDERPLVVIDDADDIVFSRFRAPSPVGEASRKNNVRHLETHHCDPTLD